MDPAFTTALAAAARARQVCFGVRLRPLTLGHLFLLAELESHFPDHPELADKSDLICAILVCSQRDHRKARRLVRSPFARLGMALWGWLTRKRALAEEAAIFANYLEEQLARPEPEAIGGGVAELRAPLAWRLLAMLMADFGYTHAPRQGWLARRLAARPDVMDVPIAFALCLWATEADRRGVSPLASERILGFRRWAREQEAARLAALAEKEAA